MKRRASSRRGDAAAGVMPFVDALFILLFSLLALSEARQAEAGREEVRVELPAVEPGEADIVPGERPLALEIDAAGALTLAESGRPITSREELDRELSAATADRLPEEVTVEIVADRSAPSGVAVELLQHLRLRGFHRVQLLATGAEDLDVFGGDR